MLLAELALPRLALALAAAAVCRVGVGPRVDGRPAGGRRLAPPLGKQDEDGSQYGQHEHKPCDGDADRKAALRDADAVRVVSSLEQSGTTLVRTRSGQLDGPREREPTILTRSLETSSSRSARFRSLASLTYRPEYTSMVAGLPSSKSLGAVPSAACLRRRDPSQAGGCNEREHRGCQSEGCRVRYKLHGSALRDGPPHPVAVGPGGPWRVLGRKRKRVGATPRRHAPVGPDQSSPFCRGTIARQRAESLASPSTSRPWQQSQLWPEGEREREGASAAT